MEEATKNDINTLETRLQAIDVQIEFNDAKLENCTVDEYLDLQRRNNELYIRKTAIEDAISRITERGFNKNKPEIIYSQANINQNRYAK